MGIFRNYLLESDNLDAYLSNIEKISKQFQNNFLLLRGSKELNTYGKQTIRQDRKPKDMPLRIHNLLNEAFEEKFGIKDLRSKALFCTMDMSQARGYGTAYAIFPENATFIYSPNIRDMYGYLMEMFSIQELFDDEDITIDKDDENYESIKSLLEENFTLGQLLEEEEKYYNMLLPYIKKLFSKLISYFEKSDKLDRVETDVEIMVVGNNYFYLDTSIIDKLPNADLIIKGVKYSKIEKNIDIIRDMLEK